MTFRTVPHPSGAATPYFSLDFEEIDGDDVAMTSWGSIFFGRRVYARRIDQPAGGESKTWQVRTSDCFVLPEKAVRMNGRVWVEQNERPVMVEFSTVVNP